MDTASYIAGFLSLVLATIFRSMAQKQANIHGSQLGRLFGLPSKNYPEDVYASMGQLIGVFWIAIGIFLTMTDEWFSSSVAGIVIEPLITFIPLVIIVLIIRIYKPDHIKKK